MRKTVLRGLRDGKRYLIWGGRLQFLSGVLANRSLLAVLQVSKAAADLMTYCDAHACEDPLITPVPTSENPFREKKFFCALL